VAPHLYLRLRLRIQPGYLRSRPSHRSRCRRAGVEYRSVFSACAHILDALTFPEPARHSKTSRSPRSRAYIHRAFPPSPSNVSHRVPRPPLAIPPPPSAPPTPSSDLPLLPFSVDPCSEEAAALYAPFPMHAQPVPQVMQTTFGWLAVGSPAH
jgi:hypothetical protein